MMALSLRRGMVPVRRRMADITAEVAARHGLTAADIRGPARTKCIVAARHEAMAACRAEGIWSYPRIGMFFNRDHTTVLYAVRRLSQRKVAA